MKKHLAFAITLAVACYSLKDLRDAECATACRREGYATGQFFENPAKCACADVYEYANLTRKRLTLPRRASAGAGHGESPKEDAPIHLGPLKENASFF